MILELLVTATVLLSGNSCAAVDNAQNKTVWNSPTVKLTTTHYTDRGDFLFHEARMPNDPDTVLAIIHAEDTLLEGPPGHKVVIRCVTPTNPPYVIGGNGNHDHD